MTLGLVVEENCLIGTSFEPIYTTKMRCAYRDETSYESELLRGAVCRGMTIGCPCARRYASAITGDLPSVLITLPIDIKNLAYLSALHLACLFSFLGDIIPKRSC